MKKLTSYHLKILAIAFMVIDHVLKAFAGDIISWMESNQLYNLPNFIIFMSILSLGRLAFPLFAYMIAQGCQYTHDIKKYISRLFILAIISEIPFQYFICVISGTTYSFSLSAGNVFFTLGLGAVSIAGYNYFKEKNSNIFFTFLPLIICSVLALVLDTDYAAPGVLLIFAWYIYKDSRLWYLPCVIFSIFLYGIFFLCLGIMNYGFEIQIIVESILHTCFALSSLLILKRYNGERGKPIKWIFYAFYPVHISLIVIIYNLLH